MKTIIELDITEKEESLLKEMLTAMNISFKSRPADENDSFSEAELEEAVKNCFGIWKDRDDFKDFNDFRKQAWKGRGL
jgi:hypothetical protein